MTSAVKKVLFMNRPNAYSMPGGDTIVMNRLQEQLLNKGIKVDFSSNYNEDVSSYDVVHIFNLTLQDLTDAFAKNAIKNNVPFVVTSLQEDFPLYKNKAEVLVKIFWQYINTGQSKEYFDRALELLKTVPPSPTFTAPYALLNADLIFPCSLTEEKFIKSIYKESRTSVIHFGSKIININVSKDHFCNKFGVEDFVLVVARLEMRKNQLMLLKALEDDDIPIVFADGGFTYSPGYKTLCEQYKRKGKTIFTGRLDDELLISAFKAAKVHCLPSWYELPGLVTIEAARYGCAVVASSWGAISDYLKDKCYYCEPDNYKSIRSAILNAYERGIPQGLKEKAESFTWEKFAENTISKYEEIITKRKQNNKTFKIIDFPDIYNFVENVTKLVEENKSREAYEYYQKYRKFYSNQNDLEKFDILMQTFAQRLGF